MAHDKHPQLQQAVKALRAGRGDQALALLQTVLSTQPANLSARWLLVQCHEQAHDGSRALNELQTLLIHTKNDLAAIDRLASHFVRQRYPLKHLLRAYKKYLAGNPGSAIAAFNYAYYLRRDGQFTLAIETYQRALRLGIDSPEEVHLNIANIYMDHLHDHAAAKAHLEKALSLNPAYAGAYHNLGNLAEQDGDREGAARYFQKCLELEPGNESALARLADTHRFEDKNEPLLKRLEAAAGGSRNADLLMALGKAREQLQDFDGAWQSFAKANEQDRLTLPAYRMQQAESQFRSIIQQCNEQWLARFAGPSHAPVFICGMFRTGSTLLEQILAAHPAFTAGGESEFFPRLVARELPDYPAGLEHLAKSRLRTWMDEHHRQAAEIFGDSRHLTDKRPDNFLYIGLIKAVLPAAKFVVTERDWRDVATSIYSVRLAASQNYATDLRHIRHYIGLQTELVAHWASLLGADLVRIRYEDIIARPRATISTLLQWLGEDWDEQCLSFHALKNSVKTASVWQVREPLHAKSVGRWRNYERQFREVFGDGLDA